MLLERFFGFVEGFWNDLAQSLREAIRSPYLLLWVEIRTSRDHFVVRPMLTLEQPTRPICFRHFLKIWLEECHLRIDSKWTKLCWAERLCGRQVTYFDVHVETALILMFSPNFHLLDDMVCHCKAATSSLFITWMNLKHPCWIRYCFSNYLPRLISYSLVFWRYGCVQFKNGDWCWL